LERGKEKSKPELHPSPFFRGPMCAIMLMLPGFACQGRYEKRREEKRRDYKMM